MRIYKKWDKIYTAKVIICQEKFSEYFSFFQFQLYNIVNSMIVC